MSESFLRHTLSSSWLHGLLFCYFVVALPVEKLMASAVTLLYLLYLMLRERSLMGEAVKGVGGYWLAGALFIILGVVASDAPRISAKGAYDMLRAFAVFFVGYALSRHLLASASAQALRVMAWVLPSLVAMLYAGFGLASGTLVFREAVMVYEAWGNLHELGILIALVALLVAWVKESSEPGEKGVLYGVILVGLLLMLAGTTSKGNVLGLGAALLFLFVAHRRRWRTIWRAGMVLALLGYIYLFFLFPAACLGDLCFGHTYEARKQIYQHTLTAVQEQPWLGHGFSMFKHVSQLVIDGHQVIMPHNVYLEMLYASGLIGTLCWGLFLFGVMKSARGVKPDVLTQNQLRFARALRRIGMAYLVFLGVRGLVDFKLGSFEYLGAVFFCLGLYKAARVSRSGRNESMIQASFSTTERD